MLLAANGANAVVNSYHMASTILPVAERYPSCRRRRPGQGNGQGDLRLAGQRSRPVTMSHRFFVTFPNFVTSFSDFRAILGQPAKEKNMPPFDHSVLFTTRAPRYSEERYGANLHRHMKRRAHHIINLGAKLNPGDSILH